MESWEEATQQDVLLASVSWLQHTAERSEKLDGMVYAVNALLFRGEGSQSISSFWKEFLGHKNGSEGSRMTKVWREGRKNILGQRCQPKQRYKGRNG